MDIKTFVVSRSVVPVADKRHSEFGGGPGRVFGDGHDLTPAEACRLARATETTDPADDANAALIREWEEEGRQ